MKKGSKHTEKTKNQIRESHKGRHFSPKTEFKKGHKMSLKSIEKRYSKNWRRKVSKAWFKEGDVPYNKGKKVSVETKSKLSKALKGCVAWNKGKTMTEEQKRKLSEGSKGRHRSPKTEFKKGQYEGDKNPAKRIEVRKKISAAKKGKPLLSLRGENHPRWKGGISTKNEKIRNTLKYKFWREAIFRRDNWTCQRCKKRGGKISSHHLYNFADFSRLRTSVENGITLCEECHINFHNVYGRKNNTKEKIEKFLRAFDHEKVKKSENI